MTTISTIIKAIAAKLRPFLISLFRARNSAALEDTDIELQAIQSSEDEDENEAEAEGEDEEERPAETPHPPYSPSPPPYTPPQQIPIEDRTPSSSQPSLASHASGLTLSPSQDLPRGEMRVRGPRK